MTSPPLEGGKINTIEWLVGHLGAIAQPFCQRKVEHYLTDIPVIAFGAAIACAENWITLRSTGAASEFVCELSSSCRTVSPRTTFSGACSC
jgi:hypothetical protein